MLGRREFLGTVGVVAAALGAAPAWGATSGPPGPLAPLGVLPGATFASCRVLTVDRSDDGAVRVRLADAGGAPFELQLFAHDAKTPGVARAGSLAVYVTNQGGGTAATREEHGLAAIALARHLESRERAGARLPKVRALSARPGRAARTRA
ncbi:MAG TPA: twin-arginine translocation signal domain-containing protein [Polyangiaceae bacterium]|jgi:hypothetical protein